MKDIFLLYDVFEKHEREKFINDIQKFIVDGAELNAFYGARGYPEGFDWFKISHPTLHVLPEFEKLHQHVLDLIKKEFGLNLEIKRSWVNLTKGQRKKVVWHNHDGDPDYSMGYYMKLPLPFFSNGTLFKDYGLVKAKQNSLMLFDSSVDHSTPPSPFPLERYTWAMDLKLF